MMKSSESNVNGRMSSDHSSTSNCTTSSTSTRDELAAAEWEMRPGGMLVQKRSENTGVPPAIIRLRIAYGALRYEISVNARATFGELKKVMKGETGLEADEQKVIYKGKERQNGEYMDICGVKNGSKVVVMEDPASIERRCLQMRKNARIRSALRSISSVSDDIDKLAHQVCTIEKSISNGTKVGEVQITTLTEMLMRQAIKLDTISAEGEASTLKILQEKRVQKCVESLDGVKMSNAKIKAVIVSTKWETFDPPPPPPLSTYWNLLD